MAGHRLTDEQLLATKVLVAQHGTQSAASRATDIPLRTIENHMREASRRGLNGFSTPVLPGFEITDISNGPNGDFIKTRPEPGRKFEIPAGLGLMGISANLDPEGRVKQEWVLTRKDKDLAAIELVEYIKGAFTDFVGRAKPRAAPERTSEKLLNLFPANDFHMGMFGWGKEVGENWDLKIAEEAIGDSADDVIFRSPACGHCIILGGGDLLHSDNSRNQTDKSHNQLDVDGRYPKVVMAANRLMVRIIDSALHRHGRVTVRILPGNHDRHSSVAVAYFLHAWYRNEPRIFVDVDPGLFFWHRFGSVLIGSTHGDEVKIKEMPAIMAHRRAPDWGLTKFRYCHGFHLHHKEMMATEGNGVICEVHQAPIPQDAWHYGSGFLSGRSLQTITYHRDFGEVSRAREAILDAAHAETLARAA